ncbi:uncharacterized protein BDR25DRAFT_350345 [Lindgomyces ingoldianus]|uniref:Uncharacterized protein n=1 Tax=Lindgomyces ingoldianus TaxID=673940 RepID=A0ACB6RAF4_9PLEO|nr:uncharacterized protein BDR25DRAFT_350345 [Lindgomyces ingoldianus]KAF2476072.1 hypothetical protein BDR25DRAFT_350345 [Lindgomyces ingoldianus]
MQQKWLLGIAKNPANFAHDNSAKKSFVTEDTVECQFIYELQGNIYLNSDVKAILDDTTDNLNRVRVWGIKGAPPPPTTKLAIFYAAGYQSEFVINATGYATAEKFDLYEHMMKFGLKRKGILDKFDVLEFQRTTYLRIFAETLDPAINLGLASLLGEFAMQHFSGFHSTMDHRTVLPKPYLSFYPALWPQSKLKTSINLLDSAKSVNAVHRTTIPTTPPPKFEALAKRESYETRDPVDLYRFGSTVPARLGGNANIGFFIPTALPSSYPNPPLSPLYAQSYAWLCSLLTIPKLKALMGDSWDGTYYAKSLVRQATNTSPTHSTQHYCIAIGGVMARIEDSYAARVG